MLQSVVALLLLASTTEGGTGRWWWVKNDPDEVWFVDAASLQSMDERRRAWVQLVLRKPDRKVASRLVKYEIDCVGRTARQLEGVSYGQSGEVLGSWGAGSADSIVPDSVGETIAMFMCASPENIENMSVFPIGRDPAKVAKDIYVLIGLGLTDEQAALLASTDVKMYPERVSDMIEKFFPQEMHAKMRDAYGLPLKPSY